MSESSGLGERRSEPTRWGGILAAAPAHPLNTACTLALPPRGPPPPDPAPLTLILHRILDIADPKLTDGEIFEVLGGIPVHEDWAYAPLEQGLEAKDPATVAAAAGALYRLRFEKRCLDRANNKPAAGTTIAGDVFSTYIAPLMQDAELIPRGARGDRGVPARRVRARPQ